MSSPVSSSMKNAVPVDGYIKPQEEQKSVSKTYKKSTLKNLPFSKDPISGIVTLRDGSLVTQGSKKVS